MYVGEYSIFNWYDSLEARQKNTWEKFGQCKWIGGLLRYWGKPIAFGGEKDGDGVGCKGGAGRGGMLDGDVVIYCIS